MGSRILICFVLLASVTTASHADDFFVDVGLGRNIFHPQYEAGAVGGTTAHGNGEALRIGYRWTSGAFSYGVETGYVNLGPTYYYGLTHYEERIDGAVLGPTLRYELPKGFFVSARGGVFRSTDHEMSRNTFGLPHPKTADFRGNVSGVGSYIGLGVGYDFSQSFGLSVNYDRYRPHVVADWWEHGGVLPGTPTVNSYTLTAEYRF